MDRDRGDIITVLASTMMFLSIGTIALRYWSVCILRNGVLAWDDHLAIASLPFLLVLSSMAYWQVSIGQEIRTHGESPERLRTMSITVFIINYLYQFGIAFPRFSILCFYYGVFRRTYNWFVVALYILGVLNVCWLCSNIAITSLQCFPIQSVYDATVKGSCINQWAWNIGLLGTSVTLDLGIFILPLPIIWKLSAPILKRLSIAAVFTCGCFVLLISSGRLVTVAIGGIPLPTSMFPQHKPSVVEWTLLEVSMSIISVSLPKIFHLFKHARRHGIRSIMNYHPPNLANRHPPPIQIPAMTVGPKIIINHPSQRHQSDAMSSVNIEDFATERNSLVTRPHIAYCMYLPEPSPVSPMSLSYSIERYLPALASPSSFYTTHRLSVYRDYS